MLYNWMTAILLLLRIKDMSDLEKKRLHMKSIADRNQLTSAVSNDMSYRKDRDW